METLRNLEVLLESIVLVSCWTGLIVLAIIEGALALRLKLVQHRNRVEFASSPRKPVQKVEIAR